MTNTTVRRVRNIAVAAALAAGTVTATAGSAQARPADGSTLPPRPAAATAAVNGPNSTYPGPGWFYWWTYSNQGTCYADASRWLLQGLITGFLCPARFDGLGYDQWLRY
ncbi:hypothetical protein QLQ12_43175 [Actinoplanes sp. NEAU-A12]|uniref:Secreted protein n=1 Tax=Actinoplanes sandaracinus TaxID=3045177 RepID=A0ABT6X077_9ACTN|nr:hypothetical protein [Actinoplanes sandaracinus]MDI6105406.1 hypothetical protein [Actinoplanes sandaracinus]